MPKKTLVSFLKTNSLVRQFSLLCIVLSAPYFVLFHYFHLPLAGNIILVFLLLFMSILWVDCSGKTLLAKLLFMAVSSGLLLFYTFILGKASGAYIVLIAIVSVPILLFQESSEKKWLLIATLFPIVCAYLLVGLDYVSVLPQTRLEGVAERVIHTAAISTAFLFSLISVYLFYRQNKAWVQNISQANHQLDTMNQELQAQKNLLKRRIAAVQDMLGECASIQEWETMVTQIFKHQLHVPVVYIWVSAQGLERQTTDMTAYFYSDHPVAKKLLYDTQTTGWNSQGVSLVLPLSTSNNRLIGLVGIPEIEPFQQEDMDFIALIAREIQRSLQFIYAKQTLKLVNVSASVQIHEKALRKKKITERELEIIHMIVQGYSNIAIGAKLCIVTAPPPPWCKTGHR